MRKLIFVSHANPEDNDFTEWLCLQLVREGYEVWSDVTRLIGGESFWKDIEQAIREATAKFLFVLTNASNAKQGTLDELHLARSVANAEQIDDFIIPLRLDDVGFGQTNVAIHRLNVIDFTKSWATGLASVLEKLERDTVPKDMDSSNASVVSSWWAAQRHGNRIVLETPELCLSNWFSINDVPEHIYVHACDVTQPRIPRTESGLPFPGFPIRDLVISFATAAELGITVRETTTLLVQECLQEDELSGRVSLRDAKNALTYLFRMAWTKFLRRREVPMYRMANDRECFYFKAAMFDSKMVSFSIPDCLSGRRSLVGHVKGKSWHFGISADVQLDPTLSFVVKSHVLYSDDGEEIWDSSTKLHRMRRSACRDWWNQHWRDRLLASMYWLASSQDELVLKMPLSTQVSISVPVRPICFESPIAYDDSFIVDDDLDDADTVGSDEELVENSAETS